MMTPPIECEQVAATQMFRVSEQQFRACKVFRDAKKQTIATLCGVAMPVRYGPRQHIYLHGDASLDFHLMISGIVRAKDYSPDGKAVSYYEIGPGELFGEFGAIDGEARSSGVESVGDVQALKIPSAALHGAIENDGSVAISLLKSLVEKSRYQTARHYELSVFAVRLRVQKEILRLARLEHAKKPVTQGIIIAIPTHQELADRLSTQREAVTRELRFLANNELIEVCPEGLNIPDIQRLAQFAENLEAKSSS